LNQKAQRVMAVLHPLKVVLKNYPEDRTENLDAVNNPEDAGAGRRKVPFSRILYIEEADFREEPPRKYFRLAPGRDVRLRYGYFIRCEEVVKDPSTGRITELHCTYDPSTRGGAAPDGRKVRGTIHWVSASHALPATVRLYDHLFGPDAGQNSGENDFLARLNPDSLKVITGCKVEPFLQDARPGDHLQFERQGYFCVDVDSGSSGLVFNRTVSLRDSWAKIEKQSSGR
ncbi:MAG: glutamine--tRNA ligase, partial [Acidobacteriota bacterium]